MTSDKEFIHSDYQQIFSDKEKYRFEALWALELEIIEPGNQRRGGHSFVCRMAIDDKIVYLKRQQTMKRRGFKHPLGRPAYYFEYIYLQKLASAGGPVPKWCYYAERQSTDGVQAILITEALPGESLAWRVKQGEDLRPLMPGIGEMLAWFHLRNIQHMAVQPVHIFIDQQGKCSIIDLERSRPRLCKFKAAKRDYLQLIRRAPWLDKEHLRSMLSSYPKSLGKKLEQALIPLLQDKA